MATTEKELDEGVQKVIIQILRAAQDFNNNPEKAEKYIRKRINDIYTCGKAMGRQLVVGEIFNGDPT